MSSPGEDGQTLEEKRRLARQMLLARKAARETPRPEIAPDGFSYEIFMQGDDPDLSEVLRFGEWAERVKTVAPNALDIPRASPAGPVAVFVGEREHPVINLSTYNYLGFAVHPQVVEAAKRALDVYGLGCGASPNGSGMILLHRELERKLVEFLGLPGYGASLFSAGYNVNTGTISALIRPGCHVVLDQAAHMSIVEGARLSGAQVHTFQHNDVDDLVRVLRRCRAETVRTLVCVEGAYSADGDFGRLADIVEAARAHRALVLADEAHSILLCGPGGRGVAAAQGVLEGIDLFVITFSKALGGIGGALLAREEITRYVDWYSRVRMFSCALDPAVTAGVLKSLELGAGPEGEARRRRLSENSDYLRLRLMGKVDFCASQSWILPVVYGSEKLTLSLCEHLLSAGLNGSVLQFPAVPKDRARLRLFVTSEHTREHLDRAADLLLEAAGKFGFRLA
ncbi:MAG: aminotransferase class I/II-fold pyridoxal phosphate-dependent enzyme [Armatimonadetes bacterium]|nr:aminotransferase class I/II-fold pyridoxal phosphate-dependent enzyme [Armatimonadota bacterium]